MQSVQTDCCIVGGGPGGLLLSLLLAKQGLQVTVLEKQKAFETVRGGAIIQPGTLILLQNEELLDDLLVRSQKLVGVVEKAQEGIFFQRDYDTLTDCPIPYALAVPLAVLRQALLDRIKKFPNIQLLMNADVLDMQNPEEGSYEMVATVNEVSFKFQARVFVGADGKNSIVRRLIGIDATVYEYENPLLILNVSRPSAWGQHVRGYHHPGFFMTVPTTDMRLYIFRSIDREELRMLRQNAEGLATLLHSIVEAEPHLSHIHKEIVSWEQVPEVMYHSVEAETWQQQNVVLMGDSAHSMHSLGGQGMNMALQDAVLLADVIRECFETGDRDALSTYEHLRKPYVQHFQELQKMLLDNQALQSKPNSPFATDFESLSLGQIELRDLLMKPKNRMTSGGLKR